MEQVLATYFPAADWQGLSIDGKTLRGGRDAGTGLQAMHILDAIVHQPCVNIGLDPGFGWTKAACVGMEGTQVVTVPSMVGVGSTDLGLLSVGNLDLRRRSRQPDRVAFDEITCLASENAACYARRVERMDSLRLRWSGATHSVLQWRIPIDG